MNLYEKTSNAVKVGEVYNLQHFRVAWQDESQRRLMGNELVYPPSPKVIQAVKDVAEKLNYYPEDPSTDKELRDRLADYVGLPGKGDWITCGNGSMEIIDLMYKTFIDEGDEILLATPDYSPYPRRAPLYGGKVIDVLPEDEDFSYTTKSFTRLITPKTKMIMASSPNNPTGFRLSRQIVQDLCDTGLIVVVDEAYVEFADETVEDMLEANPNMLINHTFSKAMGLAGIRLGFTVAHPEVISYINRVRTPLNISLVAHTAAIAAIDDRAYIEENVRKVKNDRQYLYEEIKKMPGFHPVPSQGNFLMINCKETGILATEFYEKIFKAGYIVRCFVETRGLPGNQYFRITIGTHEDVEGVLKEIRSLIAEKSK